MNDYLSVSEYAKLYDKDPGNVRRLLISGRLKGMKVGKQWIIPKDLEYPKDNRIKHEKYIHQRQKLQLNKNKQLMASISKMILNLRIIYGDLLQEVKLYGSYARGEQTEESDIDIALMLSKEPVAHMTDSMIHCVSSYELECEKVLSVIDIQLNKYNNWKAILPFYKNIEKEGITLWKAET